jgi:hypothetical protein
MIEQIPKAVALWEDLDFAKFYLLLWELWGRYIYRFEIMILLRVKAKSLLCYGAVRDLGIGMAQIARRLN